MHIVLPGKHRFHDYNSETVMELVPMSIMTRTRETKHLAGLVLARDCLTVALKTVTGRPGRGQIKRFQGWRNFSTP